MKNTLTLTLILTLSGCSSLDFGPPRPESYKNPGLNSVRFMTISDTHLYSPTLGTTGPSWEEYLSRDRKLLGESLEILDAALKTIKESAVQFLIISGDLTKDGERVNHELMASRLKTLEESGVEVYVVPGNHDINNPHAKGFNEKGEIPVASVMPDDFAEIYQDFGYAQAFSRDKGSLSYAVECAPGLVLLALDTCIYLDNQEKMKPTTHGRLKPETLQWLKGVLSQGQADHKSFILTQHHGLVEHFTGASTYMGAYMVDQNKEISEFLAREGVKVAFTGHAHSQDITAGALTDVETGSLVTFPCPLREITIQGNFMSIKSQFITDLESFSQKNQSFSAYANTYTRLGVKGFAAKVAREYLGFSPSEGDYLGAQAADAMMGHYIGDEKTPADIESVWKTEKLGPWAGFIAGFLKSTAQSLYRDLPPSDNEGIIPW